MHGHFSAAYPPCGGGGVVPEIDTIAFDRAAGIGGNGVPVAFYVEPCAEGNESRIDCDDPVSDLQSGRRAAAAAIASGTWIVTGGDHRDRPPSGEVTARSERSAAAHCY